MNPQLTRAYLDALVVGLVANFVVTASAPEPTQALLYLVWCVFLVRLVRTAWVYRREAP